MRLLTGQFYVYVTNVPVESTQGKGGHVPIVDFVTDILCLKTHQLLATLQEDQQQLQQWWPQQRQQLQLDEQWQQLRLSDKDSDFDQTNSPPPTQSF